jgi:threonine/homoserine/homoserine lactone efflux protein
MGPMLTLPAVSARGRCPPRVPTSASTPASVGAYARQVPSAHAFAVFVPATLVLLAIPGPAVLYIVATSVEGGRRSGLLSVAGIHLGSAVHIAAAVFGLSALVVSSAIAFSAVKYVGAAYLIYVGIRKLLERDESPVLRERPPRSGRRVFSQGVVVNVLNPKTALFFLAFMPQFVDRDRPVWTQIAVLGLCWIGLGLLSDGAYALAGGTIGGLLRRRRRTVRYASGGIFIGLGAVAASS